jgi:hypothetical protein
MRWAWHAACIGEIRCAYKILVGKPEGKRPLGGPKRSRESNIRMDLKETGWEVVYWRHLVQDRDQWVDLVNTITKLRVP